MKLVVLVNSGLEKLAGQEIEELLKIKGKVGKGKVELETARDEDVLTLNKYGQSFYRVMLSLGTVKDLTKFALQIEEWKSLFWDGCRFKIEILGVKGNENRIALGKILGEKIFASFKEPQVDYKNPEVVSLVYFDGKNYCVGVDLSGYDLNRRGYRVFVNSASMKGDWGYYLVRKSGFVPGEKLVVGLMKDGVVPIEAALYDLHRAANQEKFALEALPRFKELRVKTKFTRQETGVGGFDTSMANFRSAIKNAKLAGVGRELVLRKNDLDELDVKFEENSIDRLIFVITRKDEDKLNEFYYQAKYVLRKGGTLLLFGRAEWEVSISEHFKLLEEEIIRRGDSTWKLWLLEKL